MLCFLLAGCQIDAVIRSNNDASTGIPVFVVSHGWHTGIIVDNEAVFAAMPELKQSLPAARFIEFGWGDQDFYQAGDISYWLAIKALLFPTDAVLHVAGIATHPKIYFHGSEVEKIMISPAGFNKLLVFIRHSFSRNGQESFIRLGRGLYADSFFFRAQGAYHILYTCNSWIMEALTEAGLPEPEWPTLTAEGVMDQVKHFRRSVRQELSGSPTGQKR